MSAPLFTIILPTSIDRGLLLPYSIGSVQKQSIQDFELFVIGDGVNEFTREVILELQAQDSRIRFFDFPKHPRRGEENRHQVMQEANGKYIAYLADRDYWLPHHLETLALYLQNHDFASTLNYDVKEDYLIYGHKNLDSYDAASWLLSCVGHSLEMYKKLPYVWSSSFDQDRMIAVEKIIIPHHFVEGMVFFQLKKSSVFHDFYPFDQHFLSFLCRKARVITSLDP